MSQIMFEHQPKKTSFNLEKYLAKAPFYYQEWKINVKEKDGKYQVNIIDWSRIKKMVDSRQSCKYIQDGMKNLDFFIVPCNIISEELDTKELLGISIIYLLNGVLKYIVIEPSHPLLQVESFAEFIKLIKKIGNNNSFYTLYINKYKSLSGFNPITIEAEPATETALISLINEQMKVGNIHYYGIELSKYKFYLLLSKDNNILHTDKSYFYVLFTSNKNLSSVRNEESDYVVLINRRNFERGIEELKSGQIKSLTLEHLKIEDIFYACMAESIICEDLDAEYALKRKFSK